MDIEWLEDYLALRELGSFTAAAERRNASQPAFSRRIQALEAWLGVTLVDRTRRPPSFTPLAVENDAEIRNLLNHFHDLRGRLRGEEKRTSRVRLAVQHSLSVSLLPRLLAHQAGNNINPAYWLHCEDRSRCIEMMFRGDVDLLVCYETAKLPAAVPSTLADRVPFGGDKIVLAGLRPLVTADQPAETRRALPLLTYPQSNFFGQVLWERTMPSLLSEYDVETVCISGFSGALKQMALDGLGLAWLPNSMIEEEIRQGGLMLFEPDKYACDVDVALYVRTLNVSRSQTQIWQSLFASRVHSMRNVHDEPIF
jgi:LysR family transcriptional regulator, hypochlorite-specific transcription factor HypT